MNDPFVSKSNAFLDFVQSAGQLHKCRASISRVHKQNCQLQHMNWINWTLLSCACSRVTAAGTCSNSRWGISKADDQWIDTRMYWCLASVGCILIGMNFLSIVWLPHGWMWPVWAVDRMWWNVNDHLDSVHDELRTEIASIGILFDTDDIAQIIMFLQSMKRKMIMMMMMMTTHTMRPPQVRGQRVTEMKAD